MSRRTVIIISVIAVLFVCTICIVPVAIWYNVPSVRTAILGVTPTPRPQPTLPPTAVAKAAPTIVATAVAKAAPTTAATAVPPTPAAKTDATAARPTAVAQAATAPPPPASPAAPTSGGPSGAPQAPATPEPDIVQRLHTIQPPSRDLYQLTEQLKKVPGPIPRSLNRVPEPLKVGDRRTFWVNDQSGKRYYETVATLRYATDVVYMWIEDGVTVSDDAIRRSADIFTQKIYPTVRRIFGEESSPGIDGDKRLHILNGKIPDVGGYFSSADTYPSVINPYSNQVEMFYINIDGYPVGTGGYEGTLAHEFQHMIHANYDRSETSWINEGFSELAARLSGYGGARFTSAFANQPNTQLTTWAESNATAPHYGAGYLFASYSYDRFGEAFIRDIVKEPKIGIEGYEAVLQKYQPGVTFEQVFMDWLIANYLDDPKIANGRYGYPDIDVRFKAAKQLDAKGETHTSAITQYGAEYIRLTGRQPMNVQFEGATTVRLVPTEAKSGQYFMWSNRGDNMVTSLTREFDLTGQTRATLQFAAWYDIEEDWDYAYAQASVDGGKTWDLLKTTSTTDRNPNGSSYGWAFTGDSGQKDNPQWIEETGDLTPYVGKKVLVRFQMISDDAVNNNNFAIDDVRVPELNYAEGFEAGDGGWKVEGWVHTNTWLPQRYLLQLIELRPNAEPQVKPITVGADGKARIEVPGLGREVSEAILVVSAAAPVTTEKSNYSVRVE